MNFVDPDFVFDCVWSFILLFFCQTFFLDYFSRLPFLFLFLQYSVLLFSSLLCFNFRLSLSCLYWAGGLEQNKKIGSSFISQSGFCLTILEHLFVFFLADQISLDWLPPTKWMWIGINLVISCLFLAVRLWSHFIFQ